MMPRDGESALAYCRRIAREGPDVITRTKASYNVRELERYHRHRDAVMKARVEARRAQGLPGRPKEPGKRNEWEPLAGTHGNTGNGTAVFTCEGERFELYIFPEAADRTPRLRA